MCHPPQKLRRYWFVLIEDPKKVAFVYYKNEETYIARQRNVGYIRIDNSEINVVGDYLTYKNAFSIVTEKSKYMFVSETRSVKLAHTHCVHMDGCTGNSRAFTGVNRSMYR